VCTKVLTREHGRLDFQEYFVRLRCEPQVTGFEFVGLEQALPAPGVLEALRESDAVVICPSNPWVSIDPILAVPGLRSALSGKAVVAVSPLIGGKTVKGPAAKIFSELGFQPSSRSVAEHYAPLLSAFVLDRLDQEAGPPAPIPLLWTDILMKNRSDRLRLAEDVLNLIRSL
jgi:LPPG:FO 2-phospho-L-lactate transferase